MPNKFKMTEVKTSHTTSKTVAPDVITKPGAPTASAQQASPTIGGEIAANVGSIIDGLKDIAHTMVSGAEERKKIDKQIELFYAQAECTIRVNQQKYDQDDKDRNVLIKMLEIYASDPAANNIIGIAINTFLEKWKRQ